MKQILLIVAIFFMPPIVTNKFKTITFETIGRDAKYELDIPKRFSRDYWVRGGSELEMIYLYKDSSCIYIGDMRIAFTNYENIKTFGDSISYLRFQDNELYKQFNKETGGEHIRIRPDTFELSGKDKDSLYWKDIKIKAISIGYAKVTEDRKEIFDKALTTLRKIK